MVVNPNPYRAEAEDLQARMLAEQDKVKRDRLRARLTFYRLEAEKYDRQKGHNDEPQSA